MCGDGYNINVKITVDQNTECHKLNSILGTGDDYGDCKNTVKIKRCQVTEPTVKMDKRVCKLKCKCSNSANQCQIQIYSLGLTQNNQEIKLFEISMQN